MFNNTSFFLRLFSLAALSSMALMGCNSDSSSSTTTDVTTSDTSSEDDTTTSDTTVSEYETDNSIGLILNSSNAQNGYALFGGLRFNQTYLIDNCGEVVQSWDSDYSTMSAYLLENGNLLHTARFQSAVNSEFIQAGGDSGRIEIIDEQNELVWY